MLQSLHRYLLSDVIRQAEQDGGGPDDVELELPADEPEADEPDDAEAEADEPATDTEAEPDKAGATTTEETPVRGRAGDTIRQLRSRAQDEARRREDSDRRAEEAERRLRDLEARSRPQPQQVDPDEERRKLELMTPEERLDYKVNRAMERLQTTQQVMTFRQSDMIDKQTFEVTAQVDPLAKKYQAEVEKELAKIRSEGGNVSREAVLNYVLGRALREKQAATKGKRETSAQNRVRSATTRPGNARGDVSGSRRSGGNAISDIEKRLDGVFI